jgi:hypothetical protein
MERGILTQAIGQGISGVRCASSQVIVIEQIPFDPFSIGDGEGLSRSCPSLSLMERGILTQAIGQGISGVRFLIPKLFGYRVQLAGDRGRFFTEQDGIIGIFQPVAGQDADDDRSIGDLARLGQL